jgi:transposase InsO family protein
MTAALAVETPPPRPRQTTVLRLVGIAPSSWHRVPREGERKRPGPSPKPIADEVVVVVVVTMATENPWYGSKRIAVMCCRAGQAVKDREAYVVMRDHGLLKKPQTRRAELHQAAKLFELLPQGPNDLWQMDVTYIHIPGYGWWYAVTVIDYYARYLLASQLWKTARWLLPK